MKPNYRMTVDLTAEQLENEKLIISVETKGQAVAVVKSLKATGNPVHTEVSRTVEI